MKPVVAHINEKFFNPSETFIHNYVSSLKKHHPIVIAHSDLCFDSFSFPKDDSYVVYGSRFSYKWGRNLVLKMIYGSEGVWINILKKRKVRLLHAHFGPNGYKALTIKKRLSIPLITSFYGEDASAHSKDPVWRESYSELFKYGDLFLAEGKHMQNRLVSLGCPPSKVKIQRIAIPVDKIRYFARKGKRGNEKTIFIFAGRFVEKKGLEHAFEAFAMHKKESENFEFRIIGDGPLKQRLLTRVEDLKLQDCVKFLGFLKYDEYLKEMDKADIFIHPSITAEDGDGEGGAPTTILEAQALGLPVISTYHDDIPNVTMPGQSALLSEEGNSSQLVKNIRELSLNRSLWEKMGKCGREHVKTYHDIEKESAELERKYESIL